MPRHSALFGAALALAASLAQAQVTGDPIRVDGGLVSGAWQSNAAVRAYLGMPYAAPPVGALRWKDPQPVPAWQGVRASTALAAQCVQPARLPDAVGIEAVGPQTMSEDCLYLNVWTPAAARDSKLPVMVWFYGGAWQSGSGGSDVFTQSALPRQGVVLVTFNHRVGPLAFLAHPELTQESPHQSSGNYGLTDQAAALEWVKRNIASFGGDPGNVTIFGQSSGASGVIDQMASPRTQGLFQRAIAQSFGTRHMLTLPQAEAQGVAFARSAGAENLAALRAMPAQEVLKASIAARSTFFPIADGWFMPAPVRDIFIEGKEQKVPLIIGWNKDEGTTYGFPGLIAAQEPMDKRFGARSAEARALYPAGSEVETVISSAALHADTMFGVPTWTAANEHARHLKSKVWLYHYEHEQPFFAGQRYREFDNVPRLGAFHGSEVPYVFGALHTLPRPWTDTDRQISQLFQSYWINFAKTGEPNGPGLARWPTFDVARKNTVLHIADRPYLGDVPSLQRLEFLDGIVRSQR
ncbi:MAG: carboxylesterase family protein [Pseudomonadota bacterium]